MLTKPTPAKANVSFVEAAGKITRAAPVLLAEQDQVPEEPDPRPSSAGPGTELTSVSLKLRNRGGGESQRKGRGKNRSRPGRAADRRADGGRTGPTHLPDQDALALQPLPQRAVALVSHGEDVRRDLAQVVAAVERHHLALVQTRDQLVRVHRRQDGADVGLRTERGRGVSHAGQLNTCVHTHGWRRHVTPEGAELWVKMLVWA